MDLKLEAQKREVLGKGVEKLRQQGLIPAELYGNGIENVHLAINEAEFLRVYKEAGENTMINLSFGDEKRPVFVHDVQWNPVTEQIQAIDLYQVDLKKKTTANVPLEYVGESPAVEEKEGVLNKVLDEVEVEALPTNIPHSIKVDVSALDDFSKSITVADLAEGADFEILTDPEMVVANVSEPREEEEEPVEELSPEDVEVEGEKKAEDQGDEGSEAKENQGESSEK